ncbi:phosphate ABC transporter substrate-binding protein PstS [Edaphobacter flagellatus]|uniref:phosphate ABC transporter substrate-binding protein PstS n=1 Tax=Edaphobacter flagellatus TaxID=1933044 RepID=UPI0021B42A39|nr:phosphate ABC transporter substrate-binding protein PstS [Edaphobacter flagellatus]
MPSWFSLTSILRFSKAAIVCLAVAVCLFVLPKCTAQTAEALHSVQTIQVDSLGTGKNADALRQRVIQRLKKSKRLEVVEGPAPADVVLKGTSSIWATGSISLHPQSKSVSQTSYQGYLSVELTGKAHQVLWSYMVTPSRFYASGITDDLADHLVLHLLEAIQNDTANTASITGTSEARAPLHVAGATLPAPLYLKWFESSGQPVTYDAVGSEAGVQQLAQGKVDMAASDVPLSDIEPASQLRVAEFATVLGGVVPIYNLPRAGHDLNLTPEVLAGIYAGTIRKWNDPRIRDANRGVSLPDMDIAVVHRSDGSGTTYVWTRFLSLVSAEWKSAAGSGTHVTWPAGTGAAGNEGVAAMVKKTQGAIGYVELIYAIQHELNYAAVRNPAGRFIKADLASITAAANGATGTTNPGLPPSILNSADRDAYPISTFTWLLVPTQGLDAQKKAAVTALLNWMLTAGQKQCASLGYVPLPHDVAARELQAVESLK